MAKRSKRGDLELERRWIWEKATARDREAIMEFCEGYKTFLDEARTERLAVRSIVREAESRGFVPLEQVGKGGPGTRFYMVNRNKAIALVVVGSEPIVSGANVIASHLDAPRLDLKQRPLYEDGDTRLALFKTHYYGGIKKYQWVSRPLSIHGVVVKQDGTVIDVHIGDGEGDPVFAIPDLLPHLWGKSQAKRSIPEGIKGEELNVLVGGIPLKRVEKEKVRKAILRLLNERYGISEEDLISAELEVVPAGRAADVGLDRSFVGAYGQDDRASVYPQMMATFEMKRPKRTCISLFVDKEEIGSETNTAIQSRFLESVFGAIADLEGSDTSRTVRTAMERTRAISSDVNAGINPMFKDVHEPTNAARLGCGIVLTKFTGAGGKYRSNDAHAEFVALVRRVFNEGKVPWQPAELGKVDEGGGGTIAAFLAQHNMDVIDAGPPLLAMHSPFEISSKADIHATYRAYTAFFGSA
ncbi:MAG TPA: aminopeptidase [Thermoplasmata archaeon]|nr:aminopeptidase [Thermoplasmata archaeon]